MATTKKNHYYVIVLTHEGAKFVTGTGDHHTAYWDGEKKPMELGKNFAEDMVLGLSLNGFSAFTVVSKWELDHQPFRYSVGHFEWVYNDESNSNKE